MMPFTLFPYLHAKTANSLCPLWRWLPHAHFVSFSVMVVVVGVGWVINRCAHFWKAPEISSCKMNHQTGNWPRLWSNLIKWIPWQRWDEGNWTRPADYGLGKNKKETRRQMKDGGRRGCQREETEKSSHILGERFNTLMFIMLTSGGTSLAQGKEIYGLGGKHTSHSIITLACGYK